MLREEKVGEIAVGVCLFLTFIKLVTFFTRRCPMAGGVSR